MRRLSRMTLPLIAAGGLVLASSGHAFAYPVQNAPGTVVRQGDADMTCRQMADEGAALSAEMGVSGPGLLGRVGGIARAGATLLVPMAGLAVAGADALTGSAKSRREAEADTRRDRWNYLNGLYAGRRCDESSAVATPATTPTPAAPLIAPATSVPTTPTVQVAVPQPRITPAAFPH